MITLEQIRVRLAETIQQSGLKKTEIARQLGIQPTQVSSYVHGRKIPVLDTFANLCAVLDADPAYILGLVD